MFYVSWNVAGTSRQDYLWSSDRSWPAWVWRDAPMCRTVVTATWLMPILNGCCRCYSNNKMTTPSTTRPHVCTSSNVYTPYFLPVSCSAAHLNRYRLSFRALYRHVHTVAEKWDCLTKVTVLTGLKTLTLISPRFCMINRKMRRAMFGITSRRTAVWLKRLQPLSRWVGESNFSGSR